jgi:uncharacterized protein YecT (DUF1311 family)
MKLVNRFFVILFLLSTVGCTQEENSANSIAIEALQQGKTALQNKEYHKAETLFEIVLDNTPENKEAEQLHALVKVYLTAKQQYDQKLIEEAQQTLEGINQEYVKFSIKDDIESLKTEMESIVSQLHKILTLYNEKKFQEAFNLIPTLATQKLSIDQSHKLNEITEKLDIELLDIYFWNGYYINKEPVKGIYKDKLIQVEKGIEIDLNKAYSGSSIEMRGAAMEGLQRWESALNEILEHAGKEENELKTIWFLYRNKRAELEKWHFEGGSIAPYVYVQALARDTKTICYTMADLYGGSTTKIKKIAALELNWWERRVDEELKKLKEGKGHEFSGKINEIQALWTAYRTMLAQEAATIYKDTPYEDIAYDYYLLKETKDRYYDLKMRYPIGH